MRQSEDLPLDPDALAELEAIDATLAGEAVDPAFAELAELALLLAADPPRPSAEAVRRLDDRVGGLRVSATPRRRRRAWVLRPAVGLVGALAVAVLVVAVSQSGGGSSLSSTSRPLAAALPGRAATHAASTSSASSGRSDFGPAASAKSAASGSVAAAPPSSAPSVANNLNATPSLAATPSPVPNGRRTIESAQLQLLTSGSRINAVSQEVFDVVGQENGIVKSSSITAAAGNNGFATFSLSIPSANLTTTMTRLSELRYASVASSTNSTQDVNDQYLSDQRALQDARALRTSLLKQLADAVTQAQITSLTAQIHDAEASISSDEATLRGLQDKIDFSPLAVQINSGPVVLPVTASSRGGFTLGRSAHDAVRVLTVAAGVVLIALAALLPVALLVLLGIWTRLWLRRRRREQALDAA